MYVYCVYSAVSKSPKQLPNLLKRAKTSNNFPGNTCIVTIFSVRSTDTKIFNIQMTTLLVLKIKRCRKTTSVNDI